MTDIDNGGRAFPWCGDLNFAPHIDLGMTLRDYFAAKADIPWNAVIETLAGLGETKVTAARLAEYRSFLAYLQADAMIAARKGKSHE